MPNQDKFSFMTIMGMARQRSRCQARAKETVPGQSDEILDGPRRAPKELEILKGCVQGPGTEDE